MAQRLVTSFVNTVIPSAPVNVTVTSQPVGLGASGIVVIMGEADGGPSYEATVLSANSFTPDQLSKVSAKYISGQIVDAFSALSAPSNDPDITGTANLIYIIKTNNSTKASAILAALPSGTYGTLSDLNWGLPGNNYQYQVTETAAEVAPTVTGNTIPSLGALDPGMSPAFNIRLDGGALTPVTLPAGTYTSGTQVAAALTGLPGGVTASGNATTITLTVAVDANANAKGWGKSLEIIEGAAPGDAAALGLTAGTLVTSSQEPEVEVSIVNISSGLNETLDVVPVVCMTVGYSGTTATLTISGGMLTTTVTGGSGANLSINLAQYSTISELATFINSQTGYAATVIPAAVQLPTSALDTVAAIGIAASTANAQPGRLKNSLAAFEQILATSTGVQFVATATAGLPAPMAAPAFLAGGTRGATAPSDIVNAVAQMAGIQCNIIVPLFSQDASEDIALGLTSSASTYTIAAVNALVKNHCIEYSTPKLARNRICILSYWDSGEATYANAKAMAQGLASYRCSLACQRPTQVNSLGNITSFMPWYNAVVAAGMQAGGFYKSICNKLANVISFSDPAGYDSGSPGDVEDALLAGLLVMENTTAGNSWVSDQTTYGFDTNFVYNSIQAVYASDLIALDMGASFKAAFVGKSLADVSAATGLSYLAQKMAGYMRIKLIATSDDAPAGYKNASVQILAPTMYVNVEIKLATAIYFVPISINISQVQQSAG